MLCCVVLVEFFIFLQSLGLVLVLERQSELMKKAIIRFVAEHRLDLKGAATNRARGQDGVRSDTAATAIQTPAIATTQIN